MPARNASTNSSYIRFTLICRHVILRVLAAPTLQVSERVEASVHCQRINVNELTWSRHDAYLLDATF